jgi:diaminohydroxyphosphoribosylaminopyrimidine deaminase/5-amino-6-(5-phosphoribosylamino)uracil reductase
MPSPTQYIERCFQLALNGRGTVYPNPLVGAVIEHEGNVIGEGWHRKSGEPHAEVMAVEAVKNKSLLKEATLYVNLEPCSFYGKTPACSTMIIEAGIPRVVISNLDPNPKVSGSGVEMLRRAGVEVITGVSEAQGKELNRIFFTNQTRQRPYVVIKWAQSADGFIAGKNGKSVIISGIASRQLVHRWRSEFETIVIGKNTLENDNPRLDVRLWAGRNPVPVVLGYSPKIKSSLVYEIHNKIYVADKEFISIDDEKLKRIQTNSIEQVLKSLYDEGFSTVFVEGGRKVIDSFLERGLWDELRVFTSPGLLKEGLRGPQLPQDVIRIKTERVGNDILDYYANVQNAFVNDGRYL